jgi:amidase
LVQGWKHGTQRRLADHCCKKKKALNLEKIPSEWRLSQEFRDACEETMMTNLTRVPWTCGILTAKEIEITENYDASGLVEAMGRGKLK